MASNPHSPASRDTFVTTVHIVVLSAFIRPISVAVAAVTRRTDMLPEQDALAPPSSSSLKRPRPEPPSPSSSSSPKRAASEDAALAATDASSAHLSQPTTTHFPSSPLGMGMDCDDDQGSGSWVARTGQVSLSEDAGAAAAAAAPGTDAQVEASTENDNVPLRSEGVGLLDSVLGASKSSQQALTIPP